MRLRRAVRPSLREAKRRGNLAASSVGPTTGPRPPRKPNGPILSRTGRDQDQRRSRSRGQLRNLPGPMPPQRREHRRGRQAHHRAIPRRDNLPGQGIRIARLQACNADGCSGPATTYAPVIINILGHAAVRVWHTDDTLEADWDQIPAIRVVEYRLITDHAEWKTSPVPQPSPGIPYPSATLPTSPASAIPSCASTSTATPPPNRRVSLGRYIRPTHLTRRFTDPPPGQLHPDCSHVPRPDERRSCTRGSPATL